MLQEKPNTDLAIPDLWAMAWPERYDEYIQDDGTLLYNVRDMQTELGPLFARINEKLTKCRIVPGELKQTYRLDTVNYRD